MFVQRKHKIIRNDRYKKCIRLLFVYNISSSEYDSYELSFLIISFLLEAYQISRCNFMPCKAVWAEMDTAEHIMKQKLQL